MRKLAFLVPALLLSGGLAHAQDDEPDPGAVLIDDPELLERVREAMAEVEEEEEGDEYTPIMVDVAAATASVGNARPDIFDQSYGFCHNENYGRSGTLGIEFCPLFDEESDDACPAARKSCPQWKPPGSATGALLSGDDARRRVLKAKTARADRDFDLNLPEIPQTFAQILLVLSGAVLLVLILRAIGRWEPKAAPVSFDIDEEDESAPLTELPKTKADLLFEEAKAALAAGRLARAAQLLHVALLRHLDDTGRVRFHPSRTNGDYARRLRREPEVQSTFRNAARQTERLRFGDGEVDLQEMERLVPLVAEVLAMGRPAPLVPGASSLALLCVLSAASQTVGCDFNWPSPAYHFRGPTGLSALPELLEAAEIPYQLDDGGDLDEGGLWGASVVIFRTASLPQAYEGGQIKELLSAGTDVLLLDDGWRAQDLLPVTATLAQAGTADRLRVLGKAANDAHVQRVQPFLAHIEQEPVLVPRARRLTPAGTAWSALLATDVRIESLIVPETGDGAHTLFARMFDEDGSLLYGGTLFLFSDRDLFTNASLTRRANAEAVMSLLGAILRVGDVVRLVDAQEGYAGGGAGDASNGPQAGRVLQASKLLPFILQLFAALLLLFGWMGAAFGPPRDPETRHRRAFAEHVDAVGRWYANAGAPGRWHAARILSRWLHHVHRDRVRSGGGWAGLAEELAESRGLEAANVKAALELDPESQPENEVEPPPDGVVRALSKLAASARPSGAAKRER